MIKQPIALAAALAAALPALLSMPAQAQTRADELQKQVAAAISNVMPNGPSEIVNKLMNVRPEGAISRGFNVGKVSQAAFGRSTPTGAADCRTTATAAKEADEGLCTLESGPRDGDSRDYVALSFSKIPGQGNIRYVRRPKLDSAEPKPVKMGDEEAYKKALDFAEFLGIPKSEIPLPPPGAKVPFPVRTLVAGTEQERGKESKRIELQRVVTLPRAFAVPGGLLRDPASGVQLNHVIAPGSAVIGLDDSGVQFAIVDGWSDAQMDPKLDAKLTKSLSTLVNEVAEDLYNEGVRKATVMTVQISLRRAYPNPDDPNPPLCPVCGVLRPALMVTVSQADRGRVQSTEKAFFAPGLVREYDLVQQTEAERAAR